MAKTGNAYNFVNESSDIENIGEEMAVVSQVGTSEEDELALGEAVGISGLGIGIVFAVLAVLMAFITAMSAIIRSGKKEKPVKKKAVVSPAPVATPAATVKAEEKPAVAEGADMYVTYGGKRHAVSVEEKIPRFTVTVNGKAHGVDVESVEEE